MFIDIKEKDLRSEIKVLIKECIEVFCLYIAIIWAIQSVLLNITII